MDQSIQIVRYLPPSKRHLDIIFYLKPNNDRGCYWVVECGDEPKEYVAIVRRVYSKEAGVAL